MIRSNETELCRGDQVVLAYGKLRVTPHPLEFWFPAGHLIALVGRNGSGKTTLLRALIGERTLAGGEIFLWDGSVAIRKTKPRQIAGRIAFVAQEQTVPTHLTLFDMLSLAFLPGLGWFGRLNAAQRQRIQDTMEAFGIASLADKRVKEISTGERQRAALARAILQNPRLLILDEPTNHLDPEAKARFWGSLIRETRENGCDVIVSSHDLNWVRRHATWICALSEGEIVYNGESDTFWKGEFLKRVFGEIGEEIGTPIFGDQEKLF